MHLRSDLFGMVLHKYYSHWSWTNCGFAEVAAGSDSLHYFLDNFQVTEMEGEFYLKKIVLQCKSECQNLCEASYHHRTVVLQRYLPIQIV